MSTSWFKRKNKGIFTDTKEKKETPDGLWHKCAECRTTITQQELADNLYICPKCDFHNRINAKEYFQILFDNGSHEELFQQIRAIDS
jgi:acetyl-CoA carboxylase carboxyl transferase subunit beta